MTPTPSEERDGLTVERFDLDWGDDLGGKGKMAPDTHGDWVTFESWAAVAAEITRLRAEVARKDEALKPFAGLAKNYEGFSGSDWVGSRGAVYVSDLRRARAARMPAEGRAALEQEGGWKCPINYQGCSSNCGSYGCGN